MSGGYLREDVLEFFNDAKFESIAIKKMIVHVVGGKQDFAPQPALPVDEDPHIAFFLARIVDAAVSPVHKFDDKSAISALLKEMATGDRTFEEGGKELARRFKLDHVGSSSGGAFFVFQLGTNDPKTSFYSLIKYDYREAVELYAKDGKNAFRQIVQAFIKEKRAIQKSCLIRVRDGVVDGEVSAFDRTGEAPDLTDYFQKFLEVRRDRDSKELSDRLSAVLRDTLRDCKKHLPGNDAKLALNVTKESLSGRDTVDDEAIREAIFVAAGRPAEDIRAEIDKSLERHLKSQKLTGVSFKPDPRTLRRAPRIKVRTAEDVLIEYAGEQEDRAVTRTKDERGGWVITFKTSEALVEDDFAGKGAGRGA
ncbi:nucleoid-associated protein [Rhizobium sp. XQZ8]|uniref:nucleoid-associated protein n=1 Tax=Rhizobium populisoli TaxID=2859785 RepID=UPI001CA4B7BE|nr:nucleoid-associated protein [Rhizobium populisoli]MBW6424193.1 nucleoid-associated protein [Rhizobium populisoli]